MVPQVGRQVGVGREAGPSPLLVLTGPTAPGQPRARFMVNQVESKRFLRPGEGRRRLYARPDVPRGARAPSKFPTLPVIRKKQIYKFKKNIIQMIRSL